MEWAKQTYNRQYEKWMPWIEDKYLAWFGQNKTSYIAQDKLDQSKVTDNEDVDEIQDRVNKNVSGQFAKGGLLNPVGDTTSKEVFTRSERGGKGEQGGIR